MALLPLRLRIPSSRRAYMAGFKRAGISATFWAVAIFFGVLVLIGIIAWLRRTQHNAPTNPASPKVTHMLPAPHVPKSTLASFA